VRIAVSGQPPCDLDAVRAAMRTALAPLRLGRESEVSLAFVDDEAMRELNRRHRQRDRTTDVLSFGQELPSGVRGAAAAAYLHPDADGILRLGDVVMSAEQAKKQARRRGWALQREVAFLAAHGVLHLVGYEDETPAGYREMVRLGHDATRQKTVKR
jgi:probable rRNA maturation factor